LHPKHEKVPYALFRIGEAYFNDVPSPVARDMTSATKAADAFREYLRRFPGGELAAKAKDFQSRSLELLAQKEVYIGDFYYRDESWDAAISRYKKVLDLYPGTPSAEKAAENLKKAAANKAKAEEKKEKAS